MSKNKRKYVTRAEFDRKLERVLSINQTLRTRNRKLSKRLYDALYWRKYYVSKIKPKRGGKKTWNTKSGKKSRAATRLISAKNPMPQ